MNQVLRQLGGKICHFDGAMGTMLQERGLLPGESPCLLYTSNVRFKEQPASTGFKSPGIFPAGNPM